jgi:hypothetical protein
LLVVISQVSLADGITIGVGQTCQNNIKMTTPNSRYQILNNGTEVKDLLTGLIWQRCSLGQLWDGGACTGSATKYTWQQALQAANSVGNGWILPNIKELSSLANRACFNPAINSIVFPNTYSSRDYDDAIWSSSPDSYNSQLAWVVFSSLGTSYNYGKGYTGTVRLMRASQ